MSENIVLRGITWADPRGYDPVVAAAEAFAIMEPGVCIRWDKRSLQGFESTPVEQLAEAFDLMVIDHPHVGAVAGEGCLLPLDRHVPPDVLSRLKAETVGSSFASYTLAGHQWALPIDAAAQVQAVRPDRQHAPAASWDSVVIAAQEKAVLWPLRSPHALMSFFSLAANLGEPCGLNPGPLLSRETGLAVLRVMQMVFDQLDLACCAMDPIMALDALSESRTHRLIPLTYLYASYSRNGYRAHRIVFRDMPVLGSGGPVGSTLGGTGIAISARTKHPALCTRFATWLASADVQRNLYATHNGQPGNSRAWSDAGVNAAVANAYANTRLTHELAWLRPRHAGYMAFQEEGSQMVIEALKGRAGHVATLEALDRRFKESFSA